MNRFDLLNKIQNILKDNLVICNIGLPSQELYKISDQPNFFYMLGSMGLSSSIGLGLALSQNKHVISIDGDGSVLMNMNTLATIGNRAPSNYTLLIIDNGSYGSVLTINTNIYESSVANGYFVDGRVIDTRSYQSGSTYYVYIKYVEGTSDYFPRNYYSQINSNLGNPAVPNNTTFSVGAPSGNENLIPTDMPLISIRLAPSVDSSITGALGEREIINRMQLKLDSVGILTTHETEISLRLNPSLSTDTFENVENPSLCQLVRHSSTDTLASGSTILSFRASGAGSGQTASTNFDLSKISALGNSILGGDGIYPNGPDLLTVVGNIVDSSGVSLNNPYSISARITWQESQA